MVVRVDRTKTYFMCCICFDLVKYSDAGTDSAGQKWDMCQSCCDLEDVTAVFLFMTQGRRNNRLMGR